MKRKSNRFHLMSTWVVSDLISIRLDAEIFLLKKLSMWNSELFILLDN